MKDKINFNVLSAITIFIVLLLTITFTTTNNNKNLKPTEILKATVLSVEDTMITILDQNNNIYSFPPFGDDIKSGDTIVIKYTGIIDNTSNLQRAEVIDYSRISEETDENGIPSSWQDNGIFKSYYVMAYNKLKELTLDEKIGQVLLARYPDNNAEQALKNNKLSGFVFFEKDFKDKNTSEVQNMIKNLQNKANIPLLTAVDEEGGNVVRISSNPKLSSEKFKSPQELYNIGGFEEISDDTKIKSKLLKNLGLNLNLAPVVDVSTDPNDYIYPRTLGRSTNLTSEYAKTVIEASKNTGVSYTLKHFPGYGSNSDTHTGSSTSNKTFADIMDEDIPPFKAGIDAGAEAVLVSHNIISSIDSSNPASLSPTIHNLLRNNLGFTGVTITDDISMAALNNIDNPATKAILAGNDLIITTNYEESFNELKTAVGNDTIDESIIDKSAFKVLAWKYYKGLFQDIK